MGVDPTGLWLVNVFPFYLLAGLIVVYLVLKIVERCASPSDNTTEG